MEIEETALSGVLVITPKRFGDARGWFSETWNQAALAEAGVTTRFVQDNQSFSAEKGTVRGLHGQAPPRAQAKLVRALQGTILDVAVDARAGSLTYGKWVGVELSAENGKQLLVPEGFLHGFATLTPDVAVFYKCSDSYAPETEVAVRFDDPDLGIDWGVDGEAVLSAKDAAAGSWADFKTPFGIQG